MRHKIWISAFLANLGMLIGSASWACDGATNTVVKRVPTAYLAPRPVPTSYASPVKAKPVAPANYVTTTTTRLTPLAAYGPTLSDPLPPQPNPTAQPTYTVPPQSSFALPAQLPPTLIPAPVAQSLGSGSPIFAPRPMANSAYPYQVRRPTAAPARVPASVYYGKGIIGQPKLYVNGQPLRNVLRWLTF
jgi:hypothetical protein